MVDVAVSLVDLKEAEVVVLLREYEEAYQLAFCLVAPRLGLFRSHLERTTYPSESTNLAMERD